MHRQRTIIKFKKFENNFKPYSIGKDFPNSLNNQVQDEKILKLLRIATATGYIYVTELKVISGMQVYEIGRRESVSNNARA